MQGRPHDLCKVWQETWQLTGDSIGAWLLRLLEENAREERGDPDVKGSYLGVAEADGNAAIGLHGELRVGLDAITVHIEVAALLLSAESEDRLAHQIL